MARTRSPCGGSPTSWVCGPSLYKHLPDKAALEAEIISDGFAEAAAALEAAVDGAGEPLTVRGRLPGLRGRASARVPVDDRAAVAAGAAAARAGNPHRGAARSCRGQPRAGPRRVGVHPRHDHAGTQRAVPLRRGDRGRLAQRYHRIRRRPPPRNPPRRLPPRDDTRSPGNSPRPQPSSVAQFVEQFVAQFVEQFGFHPALARRPRSVRNRLAATDAAARLRPGPRARCVQAHPALRGVGRSGVRASESTGTHS
jgi:hypothetical protein